MNAQACQQYRLRAKVASTLSQDPLSVLYAQQAIAAEQQALRQQCVHLASTHRKEPPTVASVLLVTTAQSKPRPLWSALQAHGPHRDPHNAKPVLQGISVLPLRFLPHYHALQDSTARQILQLVLHVLLAIAVETLPSYPNPAQKDLSAWVTSGTVHLAQVAIIALAPVHYLSYARLGSSLS